MANSNSYPVVISLSSGRVKVQWSSTRSTTFTDRESADIALAEFSTRQENVAAEKKVLEPKSVIMYTDGACSGNGSEDSRGGWATILQCGKHTKEISGSAIGTTNNRMEIISVIKGLEALNQSCNVLVYSDSRYVVNAIDKGWAIAWRANNWLKSDKKKALNSDLWGRLLELIEAQKSVTFIWVKGHNGDPLNERVDQLAVNAKASSDKTL